jgi:monofunctional biosynthetic peptidoglycan transglycosylase
MRKFFIAALSVLAVSVLVIVLWFFRVLSSLPDVSVLKHYRPAAAAEVLATDGSVLTQYYDRKFRIWAPISTLPDIVIRAVVIAEDDTFFGHEGVNYRAVWDALRHDVQKRRFSRGGSTITQQMIKNVLLTKEKTISRKIREFVLARRAEDILTKRRILEIYLNEVEWGENIYGIEAASRYYFDKNATELTAEEAALLAGMLPNPRYYNPFKRMDKARHRQEQVLFNMQQAKILTQEEYAAALAAPLRLRQEGGGRFGLNALRDQNGRACYQRALEQMLVSLYGEHALYRNGMTIRTTIDKALQDDLRSWDEQAGTTASPEPASVAVVRQDGRIRAIFCAGGREEELRSKLESSGPPYNGYGIDQIAPASVSREQIIFLSVPSGTAPVH